MLQLLLLYWQSMHIYGRHRALIMTNLCFQEYNFLHSRAVGVPNYFPIPVTQAWQGARHGTMMTSYNVECIFLLSSMFGMSNFPTSAAPLVSLGSSLILYGTAIKKPPPKLRVPRFSLLCRYFQISGLCPQEQDPQSRSWNHPFWLLIQQL